MYIRTDNENNIIELIVVGVLPETNGYEIQEEDVDKEILNNILDYKYVNGEFIKRDTKNVLQEHIEEIRNIKINNMSSICQTLIESGITIGDKHYSLTNHDQLELIKLESIVKLSPQTPVFYHADGEKCRQYSAEEFLNLSSIALLWITYHRTYFNLLKSELLEMSDVKDILSVHYGVSLNVENIKTLADITNNADIPTGIITDEFDYSALYTPNNIDISTLPREQVINQTAEDETDDNITDIEETELYPELESTTIDMLNINPFDIESYTDYSETYMYEN